MPESSAARVAALAASGLAVTAAAGYAIYRLRRRGKPKVLRADDDGPCPGSAAAETTGALPIEAAALEAVPGAPDWVPSGARELAADEAPSQTAAPLQHTVLEDTLDCTLESAFERLGSPQFVRALKANDGARDVKLSEWQEQGRSKWRSCAFMCAEPEGRMNEAQRVARLPSGEVVVHCVLAMADVPYASYFCVRVKFVLRPHESASTRTTLIISTEVAFFKSTMLKSQIERTVLKESKAGLGKAMPLVRRILSGQSGAGTGAPASAGGAATLSEQASVVTTTSRSALTASPKSLLRLWSGWLFALVLFLMLMLFSPSPPLSSGAIASMSEQVRSTTGLSPTLTLLRPHATQLDSSVADLGRSLELLREKLEVAGLAHERLVADVRRAQDATVDWVEAQGPRPSDCVPHSGP
jgi:hypothetical protein